MTDPPKILDPPTPPPRRALTAAFIAVGLVLLLLGYQTAGLVFVTLALLSSLYDLFGSRLTGGSGAASQRGPTAGTS